MATGYRSVALPVGRKASSPVAVDSSGIGERPIDTGRKAAPISRKASTAVPLASRQAPRGFVQYQPLPPGTARKALGNPVGGVAGGYFNRMRAANLPVILDSNTGARMRMGVRYPMRGGGDFEIVRVATDYPARVLVRLVPKIGFAEQLWQTGASTYQPIGLGRLAIGLGSPRAQYRWLPVHRIEAGRAFVALPAIDLGRIIRKA